MIYLTMMKQISVWLSYQKKMKSVVSLLATWGLGIMIEHENFGLEVTNDDGDGLINGVGDQITYYN